MLENTHNIQVYNQLVLYYSFCEGQLLPLVYQPHANSTKQTRKYIGKTAPSVMNQIQSQVMLEKPSRVQTNLASFENDARLQVRNKNQISNARKQVLKKLSQQQSGLLAVQTKQPAATRFIQQLIEGASGTMVLCWNDIQAQLFCLCTTLNTQASQDIFKPRATCIDTTFNLASYFLTYFSFRASFFEEQPVFFGPAFIHQHQSTSEFCQFFNFLQAQHIRSKQLIGIAHDQHAGLSSALSVSFPYAILLNCTNHAKKNIVARMNECRISNEQQQQVLHDLFDERIGLTACLDAQFDALYADILEKWEQDGVEEQFISYIEQYWKYNLQHCMTLSARIKGGVYPTNRNFTTNDIEGYNNKLKHMQTGPIPLLQLTRTLEHIVIAEIAEVVQSLCGQGSYTPKPGVTKDLFPFLFVSI